jgi:hypothetical protein
MSKFTTDERLDDWFDHHPPVSPGIVEAHERIRAEYKALAKSMNGLLPEGPDKTVALRAIRDAAMQANAVVACAQQVYQD